MAYFNIKHACIARLHMFYKSYIPPCSTSDTSILYQNSTINPSVPSSPFYHTYSYITNCNFSKSCISKIAWTQNYHMMWLKVMLKPVLMHPESCRLPDLTTNIIVYSCIMWLYSFGLVPCSTSDIVCLEKRCKADIAMEFSLYNFLTEQMHAPYLTLLSVGPGIPTDLQHLCCKAIAIK